MYVGNFSSVWLSDPVLILLCIIEDTVDLQNSLYSRAKGIKKTVCIHIPLIVVFNISNTTEPQVEDEG